MYFRGPRVKLELGLAKGKKLYDKRDSVAAKRDAKREMDRTMKSAAGGTEMIKRAALGHTERNAIWHRIPLSPLRWRTAARWSGGTLSRRWRPTRSTTLSAWCRRAFITA
ncbi:MAG: SsrA-binding protein [Lawsonibacter sp.]